VGNKKRHQKIFDPTDEEREELYNKAKVHREKYGKVDIDRKVEWLKQRKYSFQVIFKKLKDNGYGEFKELEDVGQFTPIYKKVEELIPSIPYCIDKSNIKKIEVMSILIEAMIEKDKFDSSTLTKANYEREVQSIKKSIEVIQSEYLNRMREITIKINQPLPKLTEYSMPLHPNTNYLIAFRKLSGLRLDSVSVENLLDIALDMKNVRTTKEAQKLLNEITDKSIKTLTKELHKSVDIKCRDLPKEVREALKKTVDTTISHFIPKS